MADRCRTDVPILEAMSGGSQRLVVAVQERRSSVRAGLARCRAALPPRPSSVPVLKGNLRRGRAARCDDSAVEVRQATSGDIQAIAEIAVRSWQVGYAGQVPQAYLVGLEGSRREQAIRAMLARSTGPSRAFFVAENASGRVLGFANVRLSKEDLGSDEGELQSLYVHPDAWRHGVGTELMRACLHLLKGEGKLEAVLWVLDSNHRARRFYENQGWVLDEATRPIVLAAQRLVEVRYRCTLGQ